MAANRGRSYGRGTGVPRPIDVHVGSRISHAPPASRGDPENARQRPWLTFQQVQKYERAPTASARRAFSRWPTFLACRSRSFSLTRRLTAVRERTSMSEATGQEHQGTGF